MRSLRSNCGMAPRLTSRSQWTWNATLLLARLLGGSREHRNSLSNSCLCFHDDLCSFVGGVGQQIEVGSTKESPWVFPSFKPRTFTSAPRAPRQDSSEKSGKTWELFCSSSCSNCSSCSGNAIFNWRIVYPRIVMPTKSCTMDLMLSPISFHVLVATCYHVAKGSPFCCGKNMLVVMLLLC